MWYLEPSRLLLMLAAAFLLAGLSYGLRRSGRPWKLTPFLGLLSLWLLYRSGLAQLVCYLLYIPVSWLLALLLRKCKRGRRLCFVLLCLADILPLLYLRLAGPAQLPLPVTSVLALSYQMLKAVDALYYVYYTGRELRFLPYANYLLYFPVFTSGPIFRYRDFLRYYESPVPPDSATVLDSVQRLIRGLFKKLVLVSWLQTLVTYLLGMEARLPISLALALVSYVLLYLDMSGYADMAIAVSALCGIPAPENFKAPWTAASFTQFWRKWHITLSDWIREHIFVVLRGKKLGKAGAALIGLGTMVVMSLWHEFTPAALIQGLALGLILAVENLTGLSTVSRRGNKGAVYRLRCAAVTLLFAVNAMFFTMPHTEMLRVLKGLIRW